jgi:pullulanase
VFSASEKGWATGNSGRRNDVLAGITGNTAYSALVSPNWTTNDPGQSVNYIEAHDNLTLADKLSASVGSTQAVRSRLQRFAGSIDLLAQGMPFMQAGQEWERTKNGDDNSYSSGDLVNSLRYKQLDTFSTTLNYYKGILALRKAHAAFRMATTSDVRASLKFQSEGKYGLITYSLNGAAVGDTWSTIVVSHNPNATPATINLPVQATWYVVVKDDKAGVSTITKFSGKTVSVPARSTLVLHK